MFENKFCARVQSCRMDIRCAKTEIVRAKGKVEMAREHAQHARHEVFNVFGTPLLVGLVSLPLFRRGAVREAPTSRHSALARQTA